MPQAALFSWPRRKPEHERARLSAALNGYVMGVASTTDWDSRSSFSNYALLTFGFAAPGEYVISTYPGGTYASSSGTSFSSPLVAGAADLLLAAKAGLNQSSAAAPIPWAPLNTDLNHVVLDVYQAITSWINSSGLNARLCTCLLLCW